MKKLFLLSLSLLLAFLLPTLPAGAYTSASGTKAVVKDSNILINGAGAVVNDNILREFAASFPNAERVNWYETDNRYVVSFVERGILNRITYKKNGSFINSFRYYGERDLPYYLVTNLKKRYAGQKIFGVTEITTASDIVYYVKLEGPKYWLTVSLNSEGECAVVESYR